jgi:hypothetical protein
MRRATTPGLGRDASHKSSWLLAGGHDNDEVLDAGVLDLILLAYFSGDCCAELFVLLFLTTFSRLQV